MKMKKVSSIILTAAILLTTACSDNNMSSVNSQNSTVGNSSGGVTDNSTSSTVVENTPNKVDDTLPQCQPANLPDTGDYVRKAVMMSENGFYYTDTVKTRNNRITVGVYYRDNATGKTIPLCSKPQCMHDGNDFCTATGGGEFAVGTSVTTMYNGNIYRLGDDYADKEKWRLSLFKADLQGNELSKVTDVVEVLLSDGDISPSIHSTVFHCGKLFVSVAMTNENMKVSLYIVDLASGEVKQINTATPENDAEESNYDTCCYLTADGDWLYYTKRWVKVDKFQFYVTYDRMVMYRYNIKSGITEKISAVPEKFASFSVADGIVYYTVTDRKENTFSLYSYDIARNVTKTLAENVQQKFIEGELLSHGNKVTVVTDKKYLYVCTRGIESSYNAAYDGIRDDTDFYVYSLDGKQLLHGLPGIDMTAPDWSYGFSVIDGKIYLDYRIISHTEETTELYTIKTEDLINGSRDWTKLYHVH